jgi:hypothetical protein
MSFTTQHRIVAKTEHRMALADANRLKVMVKSKYGRGAALSAGVCFVLLALLVFQAIRAGAAEPGGATNAVDLRPKFSGWDLPIRAQGSRGTCSVFAMAGAIEYALASERGTGTVVSVEYLNWAANRTRRSQRDGGFFSELWKGFQAHGICAETNLPYGTNFNARLQPAPEVQAQARSVTNAQLRLEWIKRWDVTTGLSEAQFQEIRERLASGWPVCAGMRWPKREKWRGNVLRMAEPADVFDGHSVLLVGFKEDAQQPGGGVFLMRNSDGGARDGALPFAYARVYINDAAWVGPAKDKPPAK